MLESHEFLVCRQERHQHIPDFQHITFYSFCLDSAPADFLCHLGTDSQHAVPEEFLTLRKKIMRNDILISFNFRCEKVNAALGIHMMVNAALPLPVAVQRFADCNNLVGIDEPFIDCSMVLIHSGWHFSLRTSFLYSLFHT